MKKFFSPVLLFILLFCFLVPCSAQQKIEPLIVFPPEQPQDKYRINLELAQELIRVGKADEALKLINQLRDVYGETRELHDLLKEAYLSTKEYDKVEQMVKEDLVREPKNWMLYCELANVYLKTQREEEAKLNLNKAIELSPDGKPAYSQVASVYLRNSLTSDAIDTYKQARMRLGKPDVFSLELANLMLRE